ncbi:GmrSD restriction endonuclease domain-containing protein [Saccharomonospora azurea]|uniref:GmrSD restriction endonuclease domain-containing protein n=1 Tax=Saccharomonospora azurea TaxID=40988 RepID=UPI003D8F3228
MGDPLAIQKVIDRLMDGTVRIPGFQRSFVWPPQKAALLMDSLYKQYPVGTILLWRTGQRLKRENRLGVFTLPEPQKDYPIDYVLDGQQRLTSIFMTFQRALQSGVEDPDVWLPIYYDFDAEEDAQDSRFVALAEAEVDPRRHFPLATFFDPVGFSTATRALDEKKHNEIVHVQQRFLTALLPVQTFEAEDRASVAIVFERVNRMGIPLDTYQLLTAWTWSDEFDLQKRFEDLAEEIEEFGFNDVGDDSDLMMRCCAAVLQHDPSPTSLVDMHGGEVRDRFAVVESAIKRSVDFLRSNFHVRHVKFLPYSNLIVPLAAFFSIDPGRSVTNSQREMLTKWFWRSCLTHRYSGNPQRNIKNDIEEAVCLRKGETSSLGDVAFDISESYFLENAFNLRTVATKTLILLLASLRPKSFLSGELVDLDNALAEPNRREFHHCFPRAYLQGSHDSKRINALANIAMISRSENREISKKAPSVYRDLMPVEIDDIKASALLPDALFEDDFDKFVTERASLLAGLARRKAGGE